jgi:hypothetical protein
VRSRGVGCGTTASYSASWVWKGHQLCGCAWRVLVPCFIRSPLQLASSSARAMIAKTRIGCPSIHEDESLHFEADTDLTQSAKAAREG